MSYSFDGANDRLTGAFSGTYALPMTVAGWLKLTAHPVSVQIIAMLGNISNSANDSIQIHTQGVDDGWTARAVNSAGAAGTASEGGVNMDGVWAPLVGTFTSNVLREVYIGSIANTDSNTDDRAVATALQFIRVGENLTAGGDFVGLIAEVAMWDKVLSTAEITSYIAGVQASSIAASDLIGYWPLSADNSTQSNLGLDADGDLTVVSAVYDADHPTITSGAGQRGRMLLTGIG